MAAPELRLKVTLDTSFLKGQISRLPLDFAGANVSIRPRFDRQTIANEFRLLNRYIGSKKFNITIASNLDAEIKNADRLVKALGRVQQAASSAKGGLPIGTQVLSRTKTKGGFAAAEIKALFGAAVQGGLIDDKTLASTRAQMVTALGSIGRDSIAGLLNGLKSGDADIQNAAKFLGNNLITSFKTVLGIASPSREFKKIGESAGQGFEQGLLKSIEIAEQSATRKMQRMLDRLARMALMMSGMSGPEIGRQVAQARALPSLNFGATTPRSPVSIGPSSTGRALPPGADRPGLPGTSFASQKLLLGDLLTPSMKAAIRDVANNFVDGIRQRMNEAIRQIKVEDLGRVSQRTLTGSRVAGYLPPVARFGEGRTASPYSTGRLGREGETQAELFARRTREAYINSAARAADASQSPLALPPARDRVLGQPPLMTAPSIGGSRARPMGMTGSAPPDGPSGGGAEANAFVDASRKALAYNQALTGLRESIRGVQVAQLPLIGGIKGLAGEFGQATKQVLLYGTAYKGLAFLTSLPGEAFNAAKALSTYKNQLQAVTSETGTFNNSLAFVDNLAQRFNVPLESARQGFVKLYASMQPTGFSQEQIEGLFTGISQASAAFGLSADKVDRVNYAFAQMASKGQIMSEELKGQLGDVLPGALSLFAEAAKMSIPEFSKAMEDGAFKGEAMMQVLENVGILMKVKFGAAATGAAKTLQGALNGIQNNLKLMYEAFGPVVNRMAAVFGPQITSLIKNVTDVIKAFEAGVSTTGDSFAAMSPQAQGFYSSIQNSLPPIKALIPSLTAAAQNIGYFASSLATASQPLMGLLKLALDFISIPFVARVGVYATVISVLTSAFTLLKNTGIIQATIAMVRFIATLTVGQVQAWISSIQAAITALVAMARTANIAKLSLMALKVTLISFGVGAVLLGLDFVVQKLFNIGSAADDAKRRTAELTDELARAVETGNVAVTSAKLVETETKVQSLQESKKILQRLQSGGEVPLSEQDYQRLQRAGLAQGISRSLDPLTGKPTGKGRAAGGSSQINESLTAVQSGLVSALNDAGRAEEALTDSMQVQGNMQRALKASRDQMKDIPAATSDGTGTGSAADKARQDAEKRLQQQQQRAIELAGHESDLQKIAFDRDIQLDDSAFEHKKSLIDALNDYELSGLNNMQARQAKVVQDLKKIQLDAVDTVRKATQRAQEAQLNVVTAQRTAVAAGTGAPSAPMLPPPPGAGARRLPGSNSGRLDASGENGADMPVGRNNTIQSYHNGVVKAIANAGRNGNYIVIDFIDDLGNRLEATYSHIAASVKVGQSVVGGQTIGRFDASGNTRGAHNSVDINSLGNNGDFNRNQETPAARRSADLLVTGRVQGSVGSSAAGPSASGASFRMETKQQAENFDLVEEKAKASAAIELQRIETQRAIELAYVKTASVIKANIDAIFPVEQQKLDLRLQQMRQSLLMQGMPEEYIDYEMNRAAAMEESAIATKNMEASLANAKAELTVYSDAGKKGVKLTIEQQVRMGLLKKEVEGYEAGLASLTNQQKAYNIAALESAIASIKNADALKAQQDAIQLIDSNVESATGSYKNFIKEVIQGGDPSEALKKFQEAITDQVLTITLDFAMKPIEEFYKNALKNIFGLPTEEKQRQDVLTKMEAQLAQQRDIAASTKQTAVNTTPGGSVPGAQALPVIPFGESADAATQSMTTIGDAFSSGLSAVNTSAQGWNEALNFGLPSVISTSAQQIGQQGGVLGNSLGSVTGVIGAAASSIMGIVAGVSQMGSGGTSGVLGGIGSIFMGLGGALGGIGGMLGGGLSSAFSGGASSAIGTGASGWSTAFATPLRFANGGMVNGPTLGLVGEGKYNEAIVPLPDGRSIPVQMKGPSGGGLREAMSGNNGKASGSPILNMSFQSTNINGVEYVSRDQLEAAMATTRKQAAKDGANRGMTMTLDKLQQSPQTRNRLGMG